MSGDTNTLLLPGHSAMNFSVFLEHRCGGGGAGGGGAVQRALGTAYYPPSRRPASRQGNESVVRLFGGGETGDSDSGMLTLLQCSR